MWYEQQPKEESRSHGDKGYWEVLDTDKGLSD